MRKGTIGFTLVELLIVIVVIAILAAVSIVAYSGIQGRARDAARKNDLAAVAKALEVRAIDYDSSLLYGSSCLTSSAGWFSLTGISLSNGADYGTQSAAACLKNQSKTSVVYTDPSGATSCIATAPNTCYAYLFCTTGDTTYVLAHLETELVSSTSVDGVPCGSGWDTGYGMNYYIKASAY